MEMSLYIRKGIKSNPSNFRGITLICTCTMENISLALGNRMNAWCKEPNVFFFLTYNADLDVIEEMLTAFISYTIESRKSFLMVKHSIVRL